MQVTIRLLNSHPRGVMTNIDPGAENPGHEKLISTRLQQKLEVVGITLYIYYILCGMLRRIKSSSKPLVTGCTELMVRIYIYPSAIIYSLPMERKGSFTPACDVRRYFLQRCGTSVPPESLNGLLIGGKY